MKVILPKNDGDGKKAKQTPLLALVPEELNPDSKKLCTIVLPFGKYEYQRLPMGLCNSPDMLQYICYRTAIERDQQQTYKN